MGACANFDVGFDDSVGADDAVVADLTIVADNGARSNPAAAADFGQWRDDSRGGDGRAGDDLMVKRLREKRFSDSRHGEKNLLGT